MSFRSLLQLLQDSLQDRYFPLHMIASEEGDAVNVGQKRTKINLGNRLEEPLALTQDLMLCQIEP